jgi:hypothetical protein
LLPLSRFSLTKYLNLFFPSTQKFFLSNNNTSQLSSSNPHHIRFICSNIATMSSVPVQLPYNNHPGTKLADNLDWEERADLLYHFYAYQEFAHPNTGAAIDLVGLTDADVQYFNRVSYCESVHFSPYSKVDLFSLIT